VKGAGREAPFAFNNPAAADAMSEITIFAHRSQIVDKVHFDFVYNLIFY